jgi:thiol:disulfide interchange protein
MFRNWFLLLNTLVAFAFCAPSAVYGEDAAPVNLPELGAPELGTPAQAAQTNEDAGPYVFPRLLADTTAIVPGKPFRVGAELVMKKHWHTYYKESGEAGMPTKIKWKLPTGFTASDLLWEKPFKFNDSGIVTYGYSDKTIVAATITPPATLKAGEKIEIGATVKWLSCKDMCVPGSAQLSVFLPVADKADAANVENFKGLGFDGPVESLPEAGHDAASGGTDRDNSQKKSILDQKLTVAGTKDEEQSLIAYLGLAFVGGFILNFMPCVLPVISIKVLSFMQQAGEDPKRVFQLGMTFTAGIVVSFMTLAALVIGIQTAGQKIGWGFQFQFPVFLLGMSVVVLLFALSLFGIFYIQVSAGQNQIDQLANKEGFVGTFFKGVLATILSTPCTAPFLGTALGFAFSQPAWVIGLIFFTIAIGMSFPYIVLTAKPDWMKFLPKPGVWMEKFKEGMGFLLLATVVWLVWVLGVQVGLNAAMATVAFLVALSFVTWMVGRFTDLTSTSTRKALVYAIAAVVMIASYIVLLAPFPQLLSTKPAVATESAAQVPATTNSGDGINWQPFSIESLDQNLNAKKTVLVDFTADWCLTCKVNENTVLNTQPVVNKIKELNVVALRADWTKNDPVITKLLGQFGRSGVPLYVVFPAGKPTEPIVMPEVITTQIVLDALDKGGPSK